MGKLRINGLFWLSSRPDHRVAGILEFSRQRGGSLSLFGSFGTLEIATDQVGVIGKKHPEEVRILGMTESTVLTLDGCYCRSETMDLFGTQDRMPTADYSVSIIFVGCHLRDDQAPLVKAVQVSICHLEDWIGVSGVSQRIERDESSRGIRRFELECMPRESLVAGTDSTKLELSYSYRMDRDSSSVWSLSERCLLGVMFQEHLTLLEAFRVSSDLSTAVCIGVDSISPVTRLRVRMADSTGDRDPHAGQWVSVHADALAMRRKCDDRPLRRHKMLFSFRDAGGIEGLLKWLTRDPKIGIVLDELLSYWHVRQPYIGNRIVSLCIAAEMLYRSKRRLHRKRLSLKKVFTELAQDSQPLFGVVVADTDSWVKEVTRMRHGAAHRALKGDSERLYALSESVYLLILLNLLHEMEVPDAVLREVVQHSRWNFVSACIR